MTQANFLRQPSSALTAWFSRTIGFPLIVNGRWRRDKDRGRFLQRLESRLASQYWPLERQQAVQFEQLKRLVEHAGQQVPYYRDLFRSVGFQPRDMSSPADLRQLPLLTRAIAQEQLPRLLAEDAARRGAYPSATGGSTGVPLRVWHDPDFRDHNEAAAWVSELAMGWRPGARLALLWGASRDLRHFHGFKGLAYRILRNQHAYDVYNMSEARLLRYHQAMQAAPPEILVAYASTVTLLADFLEANGLRPNYPRVALISTAEMLDEAMRATLERVFGPRVFDRFGSREAGLIAYECAEHRGLHLNLSDQYIECLGPDVTHEPGDLILTTLNNYSMPLIRYQLDDLAIMGPQACACGRTAPLLRQVVGRRGFTFASTSGKLVHGFYFTTRIRAVAGVREFQLVQEDLRHLHVLVVPAPNFALEGFEPIRAVVQRTLGADCALTVELVDRIPALPSGKANLMLSKLAIHMHPGQTPGQGASRPHD